VGEEPGKVAVVTGAAHGIGTQVAVDLAKQGIRVLAVDIDPEVSRWVSQGNLDRALIEAHLIDLTQGEDIRALFSEIEQRFGRLDILVNNAARQTPGSITELPVEEWDRVQAVCLRAPFLTMKYAIPLMQRRHAGLIVNIASIHALAAYRQHPAYDSAKAGLVALTRQAALDYSADGIRTIAISPGLIIDGDVANHPNSAMFPVGRTGRPEDIADLVLFLCSDRAGFINGANLVVDGGLTALSPAVYWNDGASVERYDLADEGEQRGTFDGT